MVVVVAGLDPGMTTGCVAADHTPKFSKPFATEVSRLLDPDILA